MNTFVVDAKSWHYRFISAIVSDYRLKYRMPEDFCSYWRLFMTACLKVAFIGSVILAIVGGLIVFPIYSVIQGDFFPIAFLGLVVVMGALVAGFVFILEKVEELRTNNRWGTKPQKQPGLIATRYKTWKERHCIKVEYKNLD